MKRFVSSLFVALSVHGMSAQTYNSVFPIVNTVSNRPEFVAANVYMTQECNATNKCQYKCEKRILHN